MKLRIMCPGCGRKARIPAIAAGNVRCTTCGTVTDIATASKARQAARAAWRAGAQPHPKPKRAQRQAERAADQEAASLRSEAVVAAARSRNGGVEPTYAPWFSSAEEEAADLVEPAEEPTDDVVMAVLDEMKRTDLVPPDRYIPERFRTMRWRPPWE